MSYSRLAAENKLSRKINSVVRDSKRNQLIITVDVSQFITSDMVRAETYYYFYNDVENNLKVNELVADALDKATAEFLGESVETPVKEIPVEETVAEEKPKASTKKKAKATKKVEEPKAKKAVEGKPAELMSDDSMGDLDNLDEFGEETEEPNIVFDKSKQAHASALSAVIAECLPADWKKSDAMKTKVRAVIAKIHGKVEVFTASGDVLESFNAFCKAELS